MKHDFRVTCFLLALFMAAQLVGLVLLHASLKEIVDANGIRTVIFDQAKVGEVPEMSGLGFLLYVAIGVGIGTALVLLLMRFKKANWWRAWFFLAVFIAIDFALKTVINPTLAFIIAFILAVWKIYRPNVVVHNLSEVLMYSGIAIFLVPLLNSVKNASIIGIPGNIFWASILLVIISIYDFIAVFQSKHMISMAQFQTQSKVFAGLLIPYKRKADIGESTAKAAVLKMPAPSASKLAKPAKGKGETQRKLPDIKFTPAPEEDRKTAILGGGDIAFPLIFAGTVMFQLANEMATRTALLESMIIVATTTAALAFLFIFAKKDKFYPAMPIISFGCFVGYGIILLL